MGCNVCKVEVVRYPERVCARCRIKLRHGARRVRDLLYALTDPSVLALLDELADRVQPGNAPVLDLLRGAARRVQEAEGLVDDFDGWMLDREVAA